MSKHTPGPWDVLPYVDAIKILDSNGSSIALVCDRWTDEPGMPPDNARLIAAAPDMLAALQRLCEQAEMTEDYRDSFDGTLVNACKQARAAIAKAKGEPCS